MAGLDLPIVPMQHQYVVFDRMPELVALGRPVPILREVDVSYRMRQELDGLLLGPYEKNAQTFGAYGVPKEFGADPLPASIERLQPILQEAMHRVPALANGTLKRVVNGPITYTPDETPFGARARFAQLLAGVRLLFRHHPGGGSGMVLAHWIVEGEPPFDVLETDPRRFGGYATLPYAIARGWTTMSRDVIGYPYEERPAGRPACTSMLNDPFEVRGAFFNTRNGWERAGWFAAPGEDAVDEI